MLWRQTPHANSSQPPIQASPPSGVSTPSSRGAPRLSAYRLPQNSTTPATISAAAARSMRASMLRNARPTPTSPSAWKNW